MQQSTVGIDDISCFVFINRDVLVADSSGVLYLLHVAMTNVHREHTYQFMASFTDLLIFLPAFLKKNLQESVVQLVGV